MILLNPLRRRLDSIHTGVPVRRANLAVLVGELERVDQAERLVDRASNGEIVDGDLAEHAVGVDEEEAAQRDAFFLDENAVVFADGVVLVREQGDVDLAQAAVFLCGVGPGQQGVFRVGGGEHDAGATRLEVRRPVAEGQDLGRAHKGPCHGDEAEDQPLLVGGVLGEAEVWGKVC